jgi:hypothetical protein
VIKFAPQQFVNNLHIPFSGFDLIPILYKGLTSRYYNGKQAEVWAGGHDGGGVGEKILCGSQIGL